MRRFAIEHQRFIFYILWLVLGIIQAALTELQDDEAYYWVYSIFPAWGYFDHPPLTAIMIKAGYTILQNEMGVRLVSLLMNLATIMLLEKLTDRRNPLLFYAIIISLGILQVAGFMATPDIPLMFFTVLFFLVYKKFIQNETPVSALLLGFVMCFLLYSKYHGILVIFFTVLSNPKLLFRPLFLLAAGTGFILFLPHLYWQFQNDFISFKYHLLESNVNDYKFSFTTEYLFGQLLIAGPIAGIILIPAAFKFRNNNKDLAIRALQFTLVGFYVFFLLSSFRGRVEANWTAPALIPLAILAHSFILKNALWKKALYITVPLSVAVILFLRLVMIVDILPFVTMKDRFHSWKKWPQEMKRLTHGLPVVWNNSYQRASKYWFYTGQPTHSLNWYRERKNNFNYWPVETDLIHQPVYHADIYNSEKFSNILNTPIGKIGYRYDSSFVSFSTLHFSLKKRSIIIKQDAPLNFYTSLHISPEHKSALQKIEMQKFSIRLGIFKKNKWIKDLPLSITPMQIANTRNLQIIADHQLDKGIYYFRISLQAADYPPTHNSEKILLEVQ